MRAVGADGAQERSERMDVDAVVASRIGACVNRGFLAIHYAGGVLTKDAGVKHGAGLLMGGSLRIRRVDVR